MNKIISAVMKCWQSAEVLAGNMGPRMMGLLPLFAATCARI